MWFRFRPYVSVAKRRAEAKQKLLQLAKQGHIASPVQIAGRQIAVTFWGKGWCDHLESYSDFENRLPRGRTYVRNGSVVDLKIASCRITALVSGSELYRVRIGLKPLPRARWNSLKSACAGRIGSLVELLQGRLSSEVMAVVTDRENGLFPKPKEISMECSCPDWAGMCKHVAAVLYGVGARLDEQPDLLFRLRQVDYRQLIGDLSNVAKFRRSARGSTRKAIENQNLAEIFDIELDTANDDEMDATETARAATERSTQSQKKPGVKSHNI
ncbi:MAG TPA: SWIM zinc finger family protein, partial [Pirellulales bacterium]